MKNALTHVILRDELMRATRAFFSRYKFHEVISPVLNEAIPNESNLYPFVTRWRRNGTTNNFYLSTSPERSLKIALGHGLGNCFSIGHCFRNLEGSGSLHSPEFLMLEWYRINSSYTEIMKEVKEYIAYVSRRLSAIYDLSKVRHHQVVGSSKKDWVTISLRELFSETLEVSYEKLLTDDQTLFDKAKQRGYTVENASWREVFDQILVNEIETHLPKGPAFLIDFPSRISPLCKKKDDEPYLAERFELYLDGVEIANGNNENTNVGEIQKVFEKETGKGRSPLDVQFLNALHAMHDSGIQFAGVGLGLDRLLMVMMGEGKIAGL